MIIGPCPYKGCEGSHMVSIAPKCPAFSRETCEECGRTYWLKHSRIVPEAYTEAEFAEMFTVDEETHEVKDKTEVKP